MHSSSVSDSYSGDRPGRWLWEGRACGYAGPSDRHGGAAGRRSAPAGGYVGATGRHVGPAHRHCDADPAHVYSYPESISARLAARVGGARRYLAPPHRRRGHGLRARWRIQDGQR